MHPLNLALRFALELAALAGLAVGVWALAQGWVRVPAAGAAVLGAATLWGVFAVPGDPSRSGRAPVPVPGWVRLMLELVILLTGAGGWAVFGQGGVALCLTGLIVLHYACSGPRLRWLIGR